MHFPLHLALQLTNALCRDEKWKDELKWEKKPSYEKNTFQSFFQMMLWVWSILKNLSSVSLSMEIFALTSKLIALKKDQKLCCVLINIKYKENRFKFELLDKYLPG